MATLNFAGLGPVSGTTDYSTPAGLTLDGVNFVGSLNTGAYYLGVYGMPAPGLLLGAFSTASAGSDSGYQGDTIITFPGAIYAIGFT